VRPGQRIAAEPATIASIAVVASAAEILFRALACTPRAYAGGATRCHDLALRRMSAAKKLLFASGEACGDKIWEIADEAWSCKQVR